MQQTISARIPIRSASLFLLLLLPLFAGCDDIRGKTAPDKPNVSTGIESPAEAENTEANDLDNTDRTAEERLSEADITRAGKVRSVYTHLNLDDCETLRTYEEASGVELRCRGYDGIDLYVSEGDLRYDVDAGLPNGRFTTPPAFNTLGETVEWRLRDDKPFAAIVRYNMEDGTGTRHSTNLAVLSVGRDGKPGCLVGWVPVEAEPSQNEAARKLADRYAQDIDCGGNG